MIERSLTIRLEGGLGNQLFQLAAGKSAYPDILIIDTTLLNGTTRNLEIEALSESFDFDVKSKKFSKLSQLPLKKIFEKEPFTWVDLRTNFKKNSVLRGYFQHPKYADTIASDLASFIKLDSSFKQDPLCDCTSRHIAVHVRRGDYLSNLTNKKIFGVLSEEYFMEAIKTFDKDTHFILYSDSKISPELTASASLVGKVTTAESDINPFELLKALSFSDGLIMSNSSLSWWGARIGEELKENFEVIGPSTWFRGIPKSSNLIMGMWKLMPPMWIP